MSVTHQEKVTIAACFAFAAHTATGKKRRHSGLPYYSHVEAVAATVGLSMHCNARMTQVAFLHDILEDTQITETDLARVFDAEVVTDVMALTEPSVGQHANRNLRKMKYREQLAKASREARCVKLADQIDNLPSIAEHEPSFLAVYLGESAELLVALAGRTDPILEMILESKIREANAVLESRLQRRDAVVRAL